ncbi:Qat anti-phage system TatD family nuclease QatD [Priestia megaterium]|uniref:Qat anti-phage system TatD family nuclease QatD n=1 Tax=Priestia megaterium TaxID=1404 RepID=UPI0012B8E40D|nr:Qat anti-phage system TatD family nuclease QatD [Priestia megaterium]
MRNFVDFHVHIDYYPNYKEIFSYYDQHQIYTLFVTNFPEVYKKAKETFPNSKYVKLALGYHPEMVGIKSFNKKEFDEHISETRYLGEVGLDFSHKFYKHKDEQIKVFRYICEKAYVGKQILSIHSRNAEKEVLNILREYKVEHAVFHWFTGSINLLHEILEQGYYLSLNPSMLNSKKGQEIIKNIPVERILIETDGPFGKIQKNPIRPEDIPLIYNKFGQYLNVNNIQNIVYNNLNSLLTRQLESK